MDLPAMKRWQVFKLSSHPRWDRSSPPDVFLGKGNLKIFSKFCRTPIPKCDFDKVALQFYWNQSSGWVLSCKFLQVFRTPFKKSTSEELLLMRSVFLQSPGVARSFSVKKVFLEISQNSLENTCARVSFLINLTVTVTFQLKFHGYHSYKLWTILNSILPLSCSVCLLNVSK